MVKRPKTSPFHGGNPGSSPGGVTKTAGSTEFGAACCFAIIRIGEPAGFARGVAEALTRVTSGVCQIPGG